MSFAIFYDIVILCKLFLTKFALYLRILLLLIVLVGQQYMLLHFMAGLAVCRYETSVLMFSV